MIKKMSLEETSNSLTLHFLNGDLSISKMWGAYAICPGCGSGKTTLIKELIKLKWDEGVLYTAFTIDEVNSMYQWIKENMIETGVINSSDVIVLHSDYRSEGTDSNLWKNNPEELANKKIILCTHYKLLNEPLDLLVDTNFNKDASKIFPPTYRSTHNIRGSICRQWILIDEMPESDLYLASLDKLILMSLGNTVESVRRVCEDGIFRTEKLEVPELVRNDIYYEDFCRRIEILKRFSKVFRGIFDSSGSNIDKIRVDRLIEKLYLNFQEYSRVQGDSVKIKSGFSDLIVDGAEKTHLLLFDGTSDLTLYNSKKFRIEGFNNKYSGDIKFNLFPFSIDRRIKPRKGIDNYDLYIRSELDKTVDNLSEIIKSNTQTLIFTWKNFKLDNSEINDDDSTESFFNSNIVENSRELVLNENFSIPYYIKTRLEELGFTEGKEFSIEYYGSGRDKAINDYRDYDSVVLLGKYVVPNSVIEDFNLMFNSNITGSNYYSNRVIQAICRTRIRKHEGLSLNIYMSSDWSSDVLNIVKKYLGIEGETTDTIISKSGINNDYMYNKLREKGITPKKAEQIVKLSLYDSNIFNAIMNDVGYKCSISLSEIFKIIPMSRMRSNEYKYIINNLSRLGIKLNIE